MKKPGVKLQIKTDTDVSLCPRLAESEKKCQSIWKKGGGRGGGARLDRVLH